MEQLSTRRPWRTPRIQLLAISSMQRGTGPSTPDVPFGVTCKPTFTFTPDYTASVEELRQEFRRILESTPMWDKKVCVLQVSDATEQTMQIRALASASDFSKTWDLRCLVREKLIKFQQEKYPNSLSKARAEVRGLSPNGFSPNAQPIETTPSHARTGNPH